MNITSAQFESDDNGDNVSIQATIEEQVLSVPLDSENRHYAEILKQVADGTLTIADAD